MGRTQMLIFLCLVVSCLVMRSALGQGSHCTFEGVVDLSGSPVPGTHLGVGANHLATGLRLQTDSGTNGLFSFPPLPTESHGMEAEKSGFAALTRRPVEATAGPQTSLRLKMKAAPQAQVNILDVSYSINRHEVADMYFLDQRHGWVVLEDHNTNRSYLFRTKDGGKSWTKFDAPHGLRLAYFIDPHWGWAVQRMPGEKGTNFRWFLLRSDNAGRSWTNVSSKPIAQSPEVITSLAFAENLQGWIVGYGSSFANVVYKTSDGGETVQRLSGLSKNIPNCLGVYSSHRVGTWIYGIGFVLHSTDHGGTWDEPVDFRKLGISRDAFSVSGAWFFKDGRGWLVGQGIADGVILSTDDFGRHWQMAFKSDATPIFENIWFSDKKRGCVVGYSTLLVCTEDGGLTWKSKSMLPLRKDDQSWSFNRLVILSSGRGWVMRAGGYLYQMDDDGHSWRELDLLRK